MDVQILFRIECLEEVALQSMLQQHSGEAAREVLAGRSLQSQESGLQALRRRVARKTGKLEAWKLRARSSEQGLMPWETRKEYKMGQASPSKEEVDLEEVWRDCVEVEDEDECRRKLDEQRKKIQKELREVERLSFASKEMQESLKESLQHQLQEVEKRRNDLMLEHQKVQKRMQKVESLKDKRRNLQKGSLTAKEDMRKFREEIEWKEERFRLLSDKVDKNRMADAEMEAEDSRPPPSRANARKRRRKKRPEPVRSSCYPRQAESSRCTSE